MSTIPLTLIAGDMAMPRLRPLDLVSRSVGREWALLPPNVSFRAELKALYAAMMRTFCLSTAAIRAASRWDAQAARRQPPVKSTPAPIFKIDSIPPGTPYPKRAPARRNRQWNALAGGACVIGGAAAIAWLIANHPQQPGTPSLAAAPELTLNTSAKRAIGEDRGEREHGRSGTAGRKPDAPLRWNRARGDLMPGNQNTAIIPGAQTGRAASSRLEPATTSASTATAHETPVVSAPRTLTEGAATTTPHATRAYGKVSPHSANHTAADHPAHDTRKLSSTKRERSVISNAGAPRFAHASPRAADIVPRRGLHGSSGTWTHTDTRFASNHRERHMPSIAGAYSPLAPSARANSDYSSVTMSAGTHVQDVTPALIRRDRVDTDSTEWMNHMSQRRVTEIPDRFSK